MDQIKELAKKEDASFFRCCPTIENTENNLKKFEDLDFKFAPIHVHAEETHLLDLTLDEEELLKNMRKTTRYIVKRAGKEGVEVKHNNRQNSINHFIRMHTKHSQRTNGKHNYTAFSKRYVLNLFKVFDESQITVLNAEYKDFTEASLVTIKFGKSCVYYL